MSSTFLSYKIDGEAHKNHELSAEQLIASIKGFTDSVYETHKVLNGNDAELPKINVVAFNAGSFEAVFQVIHEGIANLDALTVLGFAALPAVVRPVKDTVVDVLRKIKGREFNVVSHKDGTSTITVPGEEPITTSKAVGIALRNPKIRSGIENLFSAPMEEIGTEIVSLSLYDPATKKNTPDSETLVTAEEIVSFQTRPAGAEDEVTTEMVNAIVFFTKINFVGPSGWQMVLPTKKKVGIRLEDEEFLAKVKGQKEQGSLSFRSDDLFDVTLRKTTTFNKHAHKKSTTYTVVKVVKQITDKGNREK